MCLARSLQRNTIGPAMSSGGGIRRSGLDVSTLGDEEIPDVIRSLPGGHMVEDYRGAPLAKSGKEPSEARKAYAAADSPTVDVVEELLPARYNVKSELRIEVTSGSQQRQFELRSK